MSLSKSYYNNISNSNENLRSKSSSGISGTSYMGVANLAKGFDSYNSNKSVWSFALLNACVLSYFLGF